MKIKCTILLLMFISCDSVVSGDKCYPLKLSDYLQSEKVQKVVLINEPFSEAEVMNIYRYYRQAEINNISEEARKNLIFDINDIENLTANSKYNWDKEGSPQIIEVSSDNLSVKDYKDLQNGQSVIVRLSDIYLNKEENTGLAGIEISSGLNIHESFIIIFQKIEGQWISVGRLYSTDLY